jgi:hypothetical protein
MDIITIATLRQRTDYTAVHSKKSAPTKQHLYSTNIGMLSTLTSHPFLAIVGDPSVVFITL